MNNKTAVEKQTTGVRLSARLARSPRSSRPSRTTVHIRQADDDVDKDGRTLLGDDKDKDHVRRRHRRECIADHVEA
jgi:hypothetical protein